MGKEKIIAIIGAPRSGKTFLVKKLSAALRFIPFFEGGSDIFPKFIEEDIKNSKNNLRRILWFRNNQVNQSLKALELKKIKQGVVLDTFWIDNQMYVDVLLNGYDKNVLNEMIEIDLKILHWPDIVIYLKNNEEGTRKFTELGGRYFDSHESYQSVIKSLQEKYEKILSLTPSTVKLIVLDRSGIDFERKEDLEELIKKIDL